MLELRRIGLNHGSTCGPVSAIGNIRARSTALLFLKPAAPTDRPNFVDTNIVDSAAPSKREKTMPRIRQLDGIRAVAILAVFLHHALHVRLAWMGVDLFFVLSGFLITGVLLKTKRHIPQRFFSHFYARRARRILAPYLLLLIVASGFVGLAWLQHWYFYLFLANFLMPLHITHPVVFDPLWSLAVEEQFYILWPLAVYLLSVQQLKRLCVLLIFLAPALRGMLHFSAHWPIYELTPFRMDLLAAGALLCLLWREDSRRIEDHGSLWGAAFVLLGLTGLWILGRLHVTTYGNSRSGNVLIFEASLLISVGMITYALADKGTALLKFRPMVYIGQISYSMYLVHMGLIKMAQSRFSQWPAALVAFAATVFYASVSWRWIESPLLGTRRAKSPILMKS